MKSNKFLKVTGILMIIGAGIGIIISLLGLIGLTALLASSVNALLIIVVGMIVIIVAYALQLITRILGVKNAAKPEKATICIVFGFIVIAFHIVGVIITAAGGGGFDVWSLLLGLVLPVLYLIGAFQNKKLAE